MGQTSSIQAGPWDGKELIFTQFSCACLARTPVGIGMMAPEESHQPVGYLRLAGVDSAAVLSPVGQGWSAAKSRTQTMSNSDETIRLSSVSGFSAENRSICWDGG